MSRRSLTVLSLENVPFESIFETMFTDTGFVCFQPKFGNSKKRFSVIASNPEHTFSMAGGFIIIDGHTTIDTPQEAFKRFCKKIDNIDVDPYLPFSGGVIGYIGFEGAKAFRGFSPAEGFSRLPQCRFGIYTTLVLFDHVEGTSHVVTQCESKADMIEVYNFIDRLNDEANTHFDFTARVVTPSSEKNGRMIPADGKFSELSKAAHLWLRAEKLKRIHLSRHEEKPQDDITPQKAFLSDSSAESKFAFTHEGASSVFASNDFLLEISNDEVLSQSPSTDRTIAEERKLELERICLGDSMKFNPSENGFTIEGTIRPEMNRIDGLLGLLPSSALTGSPRPLAISYIDENEKEHRSFYGGAFGVIHPGGLEFQSIEKVTTFADGMVRKTAGADLTVDQNPETFIEALHHAFSRV